MTKYKKSWSQKRVNLKPIKDRADRQAKSMRDLRLRIIVLEAMIKTIAEPYSTEEE